MKELLHDLIDRWWQVKKEELTDKVVEILDWAGSNPQEEEEDDLFGIDRDKLKALTKPSRKEGLSAQQALHELAEDSQLIEGLTPKYYSKEDLGDLIHDFDFFIKPLARIHKNLRRLNLERDQLYDPLEHDALFENWDWQSLSDEEARGMLPFVVILESDKNWLEIAGSIPKILGQGRPIRLFALLGEMHPDLEQRGRALALNLHPDLGYIGLSLRSVFVLQEAIREKQLAKTELALSSLHPSFCCFYQGEAPELAKESRAFPSLLYDPDAGALWEQRLNLGGNPDWKQAHPIGALQPETEPEPLTYAHYAWQLGHHQEFTPLQMGGVPLADYLLLDKRERLSQSPFILAAKPGESPQRLRPSLRLIHFAQDRAQLWRSLQAMAKVGMNSETAGPMRPETTEQNPSLETEEIERIKEEAVAEAMAKLSAKLLGMESIELAGMTLPLGPAGSTSTEKAEAASSASQPTAAAVTPSAAKTPSASGPWIESALCTACEECVKINKRIFVYNDQKQAVIADPKGGPFKDVVKAAEKCSAKIIHPGEPLDPSEKDLPKWIKRAAKYQ